MEWFSIAVTILFVLAILDLTVGVSNDAVNFLTSSIGSRAASRNVIMIIATLGIMVGVIMSGGMMEVARKGIFNPGLFTMPELMTLFLAVMLTDIILLDFFNTMGMPTSTTVSIVFELLGAAVAVALIKVLSAGGGFAELSEFIKWATAIKIISGIFLSVLVAFTFGAIAQFVTRLSFSFKEVEARVQRYGAIWAGAALGAISLFLILKGAKNAPFMTKDLKAMVQNNAMLVFVAGWAVWGVFFFIFQRISKFNILRIVALAGTFALAMAFAANDLVNFIGVPLAAFTAYDIAGNDTSLLMVEMAGKGGKVAAQNWILMGAGAIMALVLWTSKKARSVTETEIKLSRQGEGEERFTPSRFARGLAAVGTKTFSVAGKLFPTSWRAWANKRFEQVQMTPEERAALPAFDLLRASVNMTIAAIIISVATIWKLPLSTTYVSFMVAMGASLADRAWGKESAAYRIQGVLTVIFGWLMTAVIAFTAALIVAAAIFYGGMVAVTVLVAIAVVLFIHFQRMHGKRNRDGKEPGGASQVPVGNAAAAP